MADPLEAFCGSTFWDLAAVWNTTNPDFPECFQKTVFVWVPFGFLWVFGPLQVWCLVRSYRWHIPWTGHNIVKMMLGAILTLLMFARMSRNVNLYTMGEDVPPVDFYAPFIKFLTFMLVTALIYLEKRRGLQTTGVIFVFWLLVLLASCVAFRTHLLKLADNEVEDMFEFIVEMVYFPLVVAEFVLCCVSDAASERGKKRSKTKPSKPVCPEGMSSFCAQIFFSWFDSIALLGYKRPLEKEDLWAINEEDTSRNIAKIFEKKWEAEVLKCQNKNRAKTGSTPDVTFNKSHSNHQPSLFAALLKSFGPSYLIGCFIKIICDLLTFTSPLVLQLLIDFVSNPDEPAWRGYFYASIILIAAVLQSLLLNQYFHLMFVIGMRVRSAIISTIYRKSMRLSNSAKRTSTVGEIVNLMAVDAQRIMDVTPYFNILWSSPLQIVIALVLLWSTMGVATLAGLAIMIILIPLNAFIATKQKKLNIMLMKYKDQRVKLMNEVLSGIKVLKLYAWEQSFSEQINAVRNKELGILKSLAYINSFGVFLWLCAPFLVTLATFATFVLISEENVLDASKAFVSLSLFDIMRFPMTALPGMIVVLVQAQVAVKRMNTFLNNDELDPSSVTHDPVEAYPLAVYDATFSWGSGDEPVLRNISLGIEEGKLAAVVGPVGAGKSSLIAALLGELEKLEGRVNTSGTIAYVAQQAWIQNATLKDNVLFGNSLDSDKYDAVVEACALKPDIDMLPAGDSTEIGEKGINLSGGQKQRISLARAVYNDSQVYFLDDPLSAVDSHVGKHIFDKVIGPNGLLKNKTRILVTHGITYLSQVDTIIVMNEASISEVGSYNELLEKKGAFSEFLMTYLTEVGEDEDLEGLDDMKEELIAKLGPDLERRLSQSLLTRAISQVSDKSDLSNRKLSLDKQLSRDGASQQTKHDGKKVDIKAGTNLVTIEKSETGKVKTGVYVHYLSSIGVSMGLLIFIFYIGSQGALVGSNIWLSEWSNDKPTANGTQDTQLRDMRLGVYGALGFTQSIFVYGGTLLSFFGTISASRLLHSGMLENILRSPMSFFDTTPLGRIVNRFSKDVDVLDITLPMVIRQWMTALMQVIGTLLVISISTPIFTAVILPVGIVYYLVQKFYIASSRQLKRLESVTRSPIYSHFSESLNGAMTIRAYSRQKEFILHSEQKVDENQGCYYPSIISNRWLAVRLEFVGNLIVFFAALFAVMGRETMSPSIVGLSVSYAMSVTVMLNMLVRTSSEMETNIVAVERIKEYTETTQEASWINGSQKPAGEWPQMGEIEFRNYSTRYRSGLDLILNGISCTVRSGEKIGIVGRTGAGKSSLTLALFRIIEPAGGTIFIDGVDVSKIGLHDLRQKITIIPQDPVLFSGTLRINLDPFDSKTDEELWTALEHSHLKAFVQSLPMGLQHEVAEGGENLSVGQRQLVCLARALLRKTKILVLDEATAAVDLETDDLIQATINKEFRECTVVVIAHRLNTIMDSTRVLVLDQGNIKEFDSPSQLLQNRKSVFYGMAKDAGLV